MQKKEEKNPVGRPKLANSKTKKESLLVGLFVLAIITIVGVIGYNIIMMEFNPKYNVGTVIARPFIGEKNENFVRTYNRRDL